MARIFEDYTHSYRGRLLADDGPTYDEVVAEAKRMGLDPYDGEGEYKPAVIAAASASLASRSGEQG